MTMTQIVLKIPKTPFPYTERDRVRCGYQCPECSGIRVECRTDILGHIAHGSWQCEECGCQWDRNYYPHAPAAEAAE
jgi:hypothetical protein